MNELWTANQLLHSILEAKQINAKEKTQGEQKRSFEAKHK